MTARQIWAEPFGPEDGEPVLLVNGFTRQLTDWDDGLLTLLADAGFRLLRFDNRDVGKSGRATGPYVLRDMAADAVGVLDTLGVERAHVLGVSMGGMIAQQVAIDAPGRVRSLVSVMSTTGRAADTVTSAAAAAVLAAGPAKNEKGLAVASVAFAKVCGSPRYPFDAAAVRRRAQLDWSRGYDADGVGRQFRAIFARGQDRTEALQQLTLPTLVIHGSDDPLIGPQGGRAVAAAVPGAELWVVPGMGHDLPTQLNGQFAERLTAFWRSA